MKALKLFTVIKDSAIDVSKIESFNAIIGMTIDCSDPPFWKCKSADSMPFKSFKIALTLIGIPSLAIVSAMIAVISGG